MPDRVEESLDLCTAHYQGMREAFEKVERAMLEGFYDRDELIRFCAHEIERLKGFDVL